MIQVYTGNGKGKTTAALGLALRASGAGLKVYIAQFVKKGEYAEIKSLNLIPNIKLEQFGAGCFIKKSPTVKDFQSVKKGFLKVKRIIKKKTYDMVILDEINVALNLKLLSLKEVVELIENTPASIELVLTGRNAPSAIIKLADLVSEIKDKKHYYKRGLKARRGIEY